jgi:hypothetical protein
MSFERSIKNKTYNTKNSSVVTHPSIMLAINYLVYGRVKKEKVWSQKSAASAPPRSRIGCLKRHGRFEKE